MLPTASLKKPLLSLALQTIADGIQTLTARLKLHACDSVGSQPRVFGRIWIHGKGTVRIGERVTLDGRACPIELHAFEGAEIVIGDDVHIEAGASLEARRSIQIGGRCHIGRYCKILDNQFHPLRGNRHAATPSKPVILEPDVEIGPMSVLLPGAYVERGASVPPSKVVSRRVPGGRATDLQEP